MQINSNQFQNQNYNQQVRTFVNKPSNIIQVGSIRSVGTTSQSQSISSQTNQSFITQIRELLSQVSNFSSAIKSQYREDRQDSSPIIQSAFTLGKNVQSQFDNIFNSASGTSKSLPGTGFISAAQSAYEIFKNWGQSDPISGAVNGATVGAYIGSVVPVIGNLIGGAVGGLIGGALGFLHTGKHEDQIARDGVRDILQQNGIIDENWSLTLADGSKFNIGVDGRNSFTNLDGTERLVYNTDGSNPLTPDAIAMVNPLAFLISGGNKKLMNDFAGYFTNAILSNADSIEKAHENAQFLFASFNIPMEGAQQVLAQSFQQGALSEEEYAVFATSMMHLVPQEQNLKA